MIYLYATSHISKINPVIGTGRNCVARFLGIRPPNHLKERFPICNTTLSICITWSCIKFTSHMTNIRQILCQNVQTDVNLTAIRSWRRWCPPFTDGQHQSVTVLFSAALVDVSCGGLYSTSEKLGHIRIPPSFPPGSTICMFWLHQCFYYMCVLYRYNMIYLYIYLKPIYSIIRVITDAHLLKCS